MPLKVKKQGEIYYYSGTVAGRRLRGTTGTTDKARAERIAAEREAEEWKRALDGPRAVLTFAKAAILYRAAGKETRFLAKIEDYWKDTLVKDITAGTVRQSAIEIYPKVGGATRNRQVLTPTLAVINHCAEMEMCQPIRMKKRFTFDKKIKHPVTLEWLDAFCIHAEPRIAALAIFMFATGCRIDEARRLEWKDINFTKRTILVRDTKNKHERLANMPNRLLVALANLSRDGNPFDAPYSTLRDHWRDATKAAGIPLLTFHSCRHGFATSLLQGGIDVVTVAKLGGWLSTQLVLSTYGHAKDDPRLTDGLFGEILTNDAKNASK
jgi:integrase